MAKIAVPICMLADKDQDTKRSKRFEDALSVEQYSGTSHEQVHGWMSARDDLSDARVKEEF